MNTYNRRDLRRLDLRFADLRLGELAAQLLELCVGLLEVVVVVELERVLVAGHEAAPAPARPASPAAAVVALLACRQTYKLVKCSLPFTLSESLLMQFFCRATYFENASY